MKTQLCSLHFNGNAVTITTYTPSTQRTVLMDEEMRLKHRDIYDNLVQAKEWIGLFTLIEWWAYMEFTGEQITQLDELSN